MTTWGNVNKSDGTYSAFVLKIDDTYNLLIDATNKLQIQSESSGTNWGYELKS